MSLSIRKFRLNPRSIPAPDISGSCCGRSRPCLPPPHSRSRRSRVACIDSVIFLLLIAALGLVPQKLFQQVADFLGLLLLHPVSRALDQMKADHLGAGALLHALRRTRELIGALVAFAGDVA